MQGGCKFGFYEYFKSIAHDLNSYVTTNIESERVSVLLACSGMAELIASFTLCPLEVTKLYMQCNPLVAKKG